jgi:meiotic recombination protein REC8, fungi type
LKDVEIGRIAPEEVNEGRSSQTPWGIFSASRRGSARPLGSAAAGMSSSVAGPALGFELGPPSALSGRGPRVTTVSPLQGRGPHLTLSQRISIISTPDQERLARSGALGNYEEMLEAELASLGDESEEFQLYGPPAAVDTQTAAQRQWIAAALDSESRNFLDFLDAQVQAQAPSAADQQEEDSETPKWTTTFERLLPPSENTRVVAAQAFLHVLTLASKDLVTVRQDKEFGDIELAIALEA